MTLKKKKTNKTSCLNPLPAPTQTLNPGKIPGFVWVPTACNWKLQAISNHGAHLIHLLSCTDPSSSSSIKLFSYILSGFKLFQAVK